MTEHSSRELAALDQVEDLLDAYADARLSPSAPVLARIRRNVLAEAALAAAPVTTLDTDRSLARRWSLSTFRLPRKAFALAGAAVLTLTMGAAVLAAPAGSPFYNARVALQEAFLPSQADERLAAHEALLAERLVEAQVAAAGGDPAALAAALAAYDAEVNAALNDAGEDEARLAHLEEMLAKHVATLTALEATAPEQAAISNALDNSQKAVEKIRAKGSHPGGKPPSVPAPSR
jgi:hypothetical protein